MFQSINSAVEGLLQLATLAARGSNQGQTRLHQNIQGLSDITLSQLKILRDAM
jgi:hypothetical protein